MIRSSSQYGSNWNRDEVEKSEENVLLILKTTALILIDYSYKYMCKEPRRTSALTGHKWIQEILCGHDIRCYEMFRMEKHVFYALCNNLVDHGLKHTKQIGVLEMVAMFLNVVGHGIGNRMIQERFQHSGETVSRCFHKVLAACLKLSMKLIKPQDPSFQNVHSNIQHNNRYWPFFKDCIGAIDGVHVPCVVSESEIAKYISRKGYTSQNVMAVCDWDMCFIFALAGWEGRAHDARIFHEALRNATFQFPHPPAGKYYLVDAGYPTPIGYLGPYKSERYHLPDFRRTTGFNSHNEIFNYFHSSLRSTIERTFGVWKNRFAILKHMPKYKYSTQVHLVIATMTIHNFIRQNSITDAEFNNIVADENIPNDDDDDAPNDGNDLPERMYNTMSSEHMDYIRESIRDDIVEALQEN